MKSCLAIISIVWLSAAAGSPLVEQVQLPCRTCTTDVSPVCGFSEKEGHKSFPSECLLDHEVNCNHKDFVIIHDGDCTHEDLELDSHPIIVVNPSVDEENVCQKLCDTTINAVCTFSQSLGYKSFANICLFKQATECHGRDYKLNHMGTCAIHT